MENAICNIWKDKSVDVVSTSIWKISSNLAIFRDIYHNVFAFRHCPTAARAKRFFIFYLNKIILYDAFEVVTWRCPTAARAQLFFFLNKIILCDAFEVVTWRCPPKRHGTVAARHSVRSVLRPFHSRFPLHLVSARWANLGLASKHLRFSAPHACDQI